jgi:uncharacterized protein YifN (PemK superfamily)
MPITFHPNAGTILICHYGQGSGFQPPEMMKSRPVVVISPRRRSGGSQVATVVPLSSVAPKKPEPWHHLLSAGAYPRARGPMWAKCDMLATVALGRLSVVLDRGQRVDCRMPTADLTDIMAAVRAALGMR